MLTNPRPIGFAEYHPDLRMVVGLFQCRRHSMRVPHPARFRGGT